MIVHSVIVTSGTCSSAAIARGTFRAEAPGSSGNQAKLTFRVLGDSAPLVPLGSGQIRRQVGLKLCSVNQCNLIYVMWRSDTDRLYVVSKVNPGESTHAECEERGYAVISSSFNTIVPPLLTPGRKQLSAEIYRAAGGAWLRAYVGNLLVWESFALPAPIASLVGEAGLRSDNLDVLIEEFQT